MSKHRKKCKHCDGKATVMVRYTEPPGRVLVNFGMWRLEFCQKCGGTGRRVK